MKLWGKVVAAFSPRKDYQDALAAIESALNSGKLKHTDNASLAFAVVEERQPSRMARLVDGIDTVELHAFAEEKGMPVVTVGDIVSLLKAVMAKG